MKATDLSRNNYLEEKERKKNCKRFTEKDRNDESYNQNRYKKKKKISLYLSDLSDYTSSFCVELSVGTSSLS